MLLTFASLLLCYLTIVATCFVWNNSYWQNCVCRTKKDAEKYVPKLAIPNYARSLSNAYGAHQKIHVLINIILSNSIY